MKKIIKLKIAPKAKPLIAFPLKIEGERLLKTASRLFEIKKLITVPIITKPARKKNAPVFRAEKNLCARKQQPRETAEKETADIPIFPSAKKSKINPAAAALGQAA